MSALKNLIKKKEWKKCCGSFCDDCSIAFLYKKVYGKREGKKRLRKDKSGNEE